MRLCPHGRGNASRERFLRLPLVGLVILNPMVCGMRDTIYSIFSIYIYIYYNINLLSTLII